MNHWETLGVTSDSDIKDIKRAYSRLIRIHRPDDDIAAFQKIRTAYEYCLDAKKDKPKFNSPILEHVEKHNFQGSTIQDLVVEQPVSKNESLTADFKNMFENIFSQIQSTPSPESQLWHCLLNHDALFIWECKSHLKHYVFDKISEIFNPYHVDSDMIFNIPLRFIIDLQKILNWEDHYSQVSNGWMEIYISEICKISAYSQNANDVCIKLTNDSKDIFNLHHRQIYSSYNNFLLFFNFNIEMILKRYLQNKNYYVFIKNIKTHQALENYDFIESLHPNLQQSLNDLYKQYDDNQPPSELTHFINRLFDKHTFDQIHQSVEKEEENEDVQLDGMSKVFTIITLIVALSFIWNQFSGS